MNKTILLDKLYILSGPSGSGKSFWLKKLVEAGLDKSSIISHDELVNNILGIPLVKGEYNNVKKNGLNNIIKEILDIRMSQNMATFLDGSNLSEEIRKSLSDIAYKHGMNCEILIFNQANDVLEKRKNISSKELSKQLEKFKPTSVLPHSIIEENINYEIKIPLLETSKIDVIGDVHGLFDELLKLVAKNDWKYTSNGHYLKHQDKERKILFLGDIVDRGTQSIEILKLVKNTCEMGQGLFVVGNHEEKLISAYKKYKEEGVFSYKSMSAAFTLNDFLKLEEKERDNLFNFLLNANIKHSLWINKKNGKVTKENSKDLLKLGFCHAPNEFFDECFMPRSLALYGKRYDELTDIDKIYDKNFKDGINEHILFRGHITLTSNQDAVYSLEDGQAFEGNLVMLRLDSYIDLLRKNKWEPKFKIFEKSVLKYKTDFNFDNYVMEKKMILNEMNKLVESGLATDGWRKDSVTGQKKAHEDGFKIYKYSKRVHFKKLWKTNPWLEKARGLVLDPMGNIIVHPFDKLYNFGEYNVGQRVPKDKKVQVIEKVNGYLGCISKHPFKNELLLSTTGSLGHDAPYVKMIGDFITPELNGKLINFFKNNDMTLMFEVVHKNDPHIIEYSEKDYGLWLIGARKKDLKAQTESEEYLDRISKTLGFKRPQWEEKTFGEVLESLQTSQLEGFMIRDGDTHEPMMKIKTNYYLVTKFVGRMGGNMVKMMFNHPEKFKEDKVDEEFYPIVDKIISKISENDFNEMPQSERVLFVREIVNETRSEFLSVNKKKLNIK